MFNISNSQLVLLASHLGFNSLITNVQIFTVIPLARLNIYNKLKILPSRRTSYAGGNKTWQVCTLNVIAITQTAKLLLSSRVPYVKTNHSSVGVEGKGVDFHSKCS